MTLYEQIYDWDNLSLAFEEVGKTHRFNSDFMELAFDEYQCLANLQWHLIYRTYKFSRCRHYQVREPKLRNITEPQMLDRIVMRAIYNIINPLFEKRFVSRSYASRKGGLKPITNEDGKTYLIPHKEGKGTVNSCAGVQFCIRASLATMKEPFVVDIDFHHYFRNINHNILKKVIRNTIDDKDVINLLFFIIDMEFEHLSGEQWLRFIGDDTGRGIPIGFLLSQLFANAIGDIVDHYIMEEMGCRYYIRYMDDIRIFTDSKNNAFDILYNIDSFVSNKLELAPNEKKTKIYKLSSYVNFCGYRCYPNHLEVMRKTADRAYRRTKKIRKLVETGELEEVRLIESTQSFLAHVKYTKWTMLCQKVIDVSGLKFNKITRELL
jgi:hypothetical protein